MGPYRPKEASPAGLAIMALTTVIKPMLVPSTATTPRASAMVVRTDPSRVMPRKLAPPKSEFIRTLKRRISMGNCTRRGRHPAAGLTLFSL